MWKPVQAWRTSTRPADAMQMHGSNWAAKTKKGNDLVWKLNIVDMPEECRTQDCEWPPEELAF